MDKNLADEIYRLVSDIAARRYDTLAADGRIGRLTTLELEQAITQYGKTIVPLSEQSLALVELYADQVDADRCAVDVPLWTLEEGRGDLTLLLAAQKYANGWSVTLDDIRVL
jgi:hypothetical protein